MRWSLSRIWHRPADRRGLLPAGSRGFTMVEMMITVMVLAVVSLVLMTVMLASSRNKVSTQNRVESVQAARVAVDLMARDLRSAGYGADINYVASPQPPIAYIDSMQVLINENLNDNGRTPMAYNPAGAPKPNPVNGTSWQPPIKYRSGAEMVRWTLDVNNDGAVDANDLSDPNGVDAQRTPNPNDFVLVREVYGDSLNNLAGDNGGAIERVALLRRPGGTIPPMFTVYMKGSATPWDWSGGPVPKTRLADIERITVRVVAPSSRPDWRGSYSETTLRTDVNSLRNIPNWGSDTYAVDGFIFEDQDGNGQKDGTDPGLPNVSVRLGSSYVVTTDSSGYFVLHAPAGVYALRHTPPLGYGVLTQPDSFLVTIGPGVTRSFADTARAGGWVAVHVYDDLNSSATQDMGEPPLQSVKVTLTPGPDVKYTNASGNNSLFAPVGNYSVTVTPPDSFVATTTNPVTSTMTDGGSDSYNFGLKKAPMATVNGKVFRDNSRNGAYDAGEPGVQNTWVGVSPDGGITVLGYAYTNATGDYSIQVPANSPPGTTPYYAFCIVPAGYFATGSTAVGPLVLTGGQISNNNNFGIVGYQIITLNASRVLSLASRDLIEKDWNGNQTQNAHGDPDIVLGADANGTDQISVWFNDWSNNPVFQSTPDYTRSAPQSVTALAMDTLDTGAPVGRPDVVTGTRKAGTGNFFVWLDQNTSGNLGYIPTSPTRSYTTNDLGDVQAILTADLMGAGTADMPDILVGTKSPTAGQGTLELWQNGGGATPDWTRSEIYPPSGLIPLNALGEVTCMALADFDNDGKKDLVVGTNTSTSPTSWNGKVLFFRNMGRGASPHFVYQTSFTNNSASITALTVADVDGDGNRDVVAGTQSGLSSGELTWYRNRTPIIFDFQRKQEVAAPGIVMSMATGDFGGTLRSDIAVGYRQSTSTFAGGVRVFYTDLGTLPNNGGVDPSGGSVVNMVPALTVNNFNYGVNPPATAPFLSDLAAGVKVTATTGALVVFIR